MSKEPVKSNIIKLEPIWETETLSGWHEFNGISSALRGDGTRVYRFEYTKGSSDEQRYIVYEAKRKVRNILTGAVIDIEIGRFYDKRLGDL